MKNFKQEFQLLLNLYRQKKFFEAEILSKRLINIYPDNAILYNILGLVLSEQDKKDEAIECYNKGLKVDPNFALIYNNLGTIYRSRDENDESESYFKKSISLDKNIAEPHNNLGNLYKTLKKYEEAINSYKKAINIKPNFFAFHYNLAAAYKSIGLFEEAKKHFKETIKLNKIFFTAHRNLSELIDYKNNDEHLILLNELYNNEKIPKKNKKELIFALAKAHEDIKDFKKAYKYYDEANFLHRKDIKFSISEEKNEFKNIKKIFDYKTFMKFKNLGSQNSSPIFILGMPRSGTTLIEQIISNHPDVYGGDELNFIPDMIKKYLHNKDFKISFENLNNIGNNDLKKIGDEYIKKVKNISKNAIKITDKLPINFKWLGFIKLILPKSKIIHCTRNSKDNCLSIFKNFFTSTELTFAYKLEEIVEFYNLYYDLMLYWKKTIPNFIYEAKYENITENTELEIKKLLEACNLKWNINCLNFHNNKRPILTASDTQARKKIYKTSIKIWKRYENELKENFSKLSS